MGSARLWALTGWVLHRGRDWRKGQSHGSHFHILKKPGRAEKKADGKPNRKPSLLVTFLH